MPVYKDKLRGSWYFDIRYRDSEGRVRSIKRRGFKTEQIALNAERKFLRESRPESLPKTRLTIREIGLEMIDEQKHDIKEHTFNASRHKITSFIPNVSISNITPRKALQWRNSLAELQSPVKIKKDGSTTGGKPYSTKYKNEIITLYKSIFKYALKMDYIVKDTSVDILPFKKQYEDTIPYNIVSYKAFMGAWDALPTKTMTNNFFKFFILLSFSTGARRAELKGLQFKDYDGKGIYINKSVTGKNNDRSLIEKTKTPASIRYVELDKFTIQHLDSYCSLLKKNYNIKSTDFLFGITNPLPNNTIQYAFKRMGLDCRLHDLRHSHATMLIQNGVPINVVSRRLGHSTVEMTLKVYTHVFEESQNQAVAALNKIFEH